MSTILVPSELGDSTKIDTLVSYPDILRSNALVTLNWRSTQVLLPAGCAVLACLAETAIEAKCKIKSIELRKPIKENYFVKTFNQQTKDQIFDLTAWKRLEKNFIFIGANAKSTTVIHDYIDQYLKLSENRNYDVKLIMNELITNAVDHSGADRYFLYTAVVEQEIHLGVLDMGVGIPSKLAQKYSFADDLDNLRQSTKLGISTRRERVGGRGLNTVFDFLKNSDGSLTLISAKAGLRRYFKDYKVKPYRFENPLRGTWVFCRLKDK